VCTEREITKKRSSNGGEEFRILEIDGWDNKGLHFCFWKKGQFCVFMGWFILQKKRKVWRRAMEQDIKSKKEQREEKWRRKRAQFGIGDDWKQKVFKKGCGMGVCT